MPSPSTTASSLTTILTASAIFGAVEAAGERVFFKIDYFDRTLAMASPNPADLSVTSRVLTVMLACEY